jgi:hypothetical protein
VTAFAEDAEVIRKTVGQGSGEAGVDPAHVPLAGCNGRDLPCKIHVMPRFECHQPTIPAIMNATDYERKERYVKLVSYVK